MIDNERSDADQSIQTAIIKSPEIKKVLTFTNSNGILINQARVEYYDGTQTTIYDKCNRRFSEQVREIPEGHFIVGIYGRKYSDYLYHVGFIVAKYSQ